MATATTLGVRDEFINTTDGWIGVVAIGPHGEQKGVAVEPRGNVWLSEDEQILTANAPRSDDDNPFINGTLQLRTRGKNVKSRRPYGPDAVEQVDDGRPGADGSSDTAPAPEPADTVPEETGATPTPAGEPELGQAAAGEEVATPKAAMRPKSTGGRRSRS